MDLACRTQRATPTAAEMLHLTSLLLHALLLPTPTRREALQLAVGVPAATAAFAVRPAVAATPLLSSAWTATAGFNDTAFIKFDEGAYKAMMDDERRTPLFERAIKERLAAMPDAVVVDLGTGPFAVLALIAARAGARKVYAIEAIPAAAKRAREAVKKATDVPPGCIEILEGFSTAVSLPEKADLVVAEIVGSVASEEGMHATLRDAQARFLKRPHDPSSFIPTRCQTVAAPAAYALHYALGPPRYDWAKIAAEPVRLNCRDETLQLLSDPVLLEDIAFADPQLPPPGAWKPAGPQGLSFTIDGARIDANERTYREELRREGAKEEEARAVAAGAARALSGIALWPRLVLDPEGAIVVESRGPQGQTQKSHWQTVLPLMSAVPVMDPVAPGERFALDALILLGEAIDEPVRYELELSRVAED